MSKIPKTRKNPQGAPLEEQRLNAQHGADLEPLPAIALGNVLDRYDIGILKELQEDARLSNAELAQRIGLSAAPTWRRVKRLEEQGFIVAYRAEIDRRVPGTSSCACRRACP